MARKLYPSDVTDDEWLFVLPYLTLMREDAPQREYDLREIFNALRWILRAGSPWRYLPGDFPPWQMVYQQCQRWLAAGVFEALVHDLRELLRMAQGRDKDPTAIVIDSRTLQSTPESGERAGYDGAKRKKGSKIHAVVDTLGHLLALRVTAADQQDRQQVKSLARQVQKVTHKTVELAYVDQGYTGAQPNQDAAQQGIQLQVVKLLKAKSPKRATRQGERGFVLLPRRWVVERTFAWMARCRRLAKDYERLPRTLMGLHFAAFACLMLARLLFNSS